VPQYTQLNSTLLKIHALDGREFDWLVYSAFLVNVLSTKPNGPSTDYRAANGIFAIVIIVPQ